MAKTVLTNARVFTVGLDMTGSSNQVEPEFTVADADVTTFASLGAEELIGGLGASKLNVMGFWEAGAADLVDDALWANVGDAAGPWTLGPVGAADGAMAYLGRIHQGSYAFGGKVGDVAPYKLTGVGSGVFARGVIAHPPGVARTASGTGTAVNLGAVAAGQQLVAAVHVLSVSVGSLNITVRVETDDAAGFTTPTTRATAVTATNGNSPQGQWLTAAGAITDTWQRAAWTTSGSGSALFVVSIGIV